MSDDKKSWREIDQVRDRGFKKPEKKISKMEERARNLASKAARQELENLFTSSGVNKEKAKRMKEIHSLRGSPSYYEKLTAYYKDYGVPRDLDTQMIFLDHKDFTIVLEVMDQLVKTAPKESLEKQNLLNSKLRVMALSTFDGKILDKIKEIQAAILR